MCSRTLFAADGSARAGKTEEKANPHRSQSAEQLDRLQPWQSIRHLGAGFMATTEQFEHGQITMSPPKIDTYGIDKSRLLSQFFSDAVEVHG
jgi:hypothetical protein